MREPAVIVVDNDAFTRTTVAGALEGRGVSVVGSFTDARSCLAQRHEWLPTVQVAILDLDLGVGPTGLDVATALRKDKPDLGLVLLTHYRDPRLLTSDIPRFPSGLRYVAKADVDDVSVLVRAVLSAKETPLRCPAGEFTPDKDLAGLTVTQIEVLRAVAQGYSTPEIARMRQVSPKAVEKVLTRICEELQLPRAATHNQRVQLVRAFMRMTGQTDALPDVNE